MNTQWRRAAQERQLDAAPAFGPAVLAKKDDFAPFRLGAGRIPSSHGAMFAPTSED
jgi:hypothetical protein